MSELLAIRFARNPSVVNRRVAGETILVPIERQIDKEPVLYTLDETAAFLWDRINGQQTGWDLVDALAARYDVERTQAERDVRTFLEQLQGIGAIRAPESDKVPVEDSQR
jgi:hypothetical protein